MLAELAGKFGVSRERARQIEVRAFEKVQKTLKQESQRSKLRLTGRKQQWSVACPAQYRALRRSARTTKCSKQPVLT
jgi:hypothetical protein